MWSVLEQAVGLKVPEWPADLKAFARDSVLSVAGEVYRRLINFFMVFPWLLVPLADPDVPAIRKQAIVAYLFACPEEALDSSFSLKVRRLAGSPEVSRARCRCIFSCKFVLSNRTPFPHSRFDRWVGVGGGGGGSLGNRSSGVNISIPLGAAAS
jgi:hypothetical protein